MKQANQVNWMNCVLRTNQVKQVQVSIVRESACWRMVNWVNSGGSGDPAASKHLVSSHHLTTGAYREVKKRGQKN